MSRYIVLIEKPEEEKMSFVGLVQVCTDETAATLKANVIVACALHVMLLKFTQTFRRFFIDHRRMFVGLLPVRAKSDEQDDRERKF